MEEQTEIDLPTNNEPTLQEVLDRVRSVASVGLKIISWTEKEAGDSKGTDGSRKLATDQYDLLNSLFNDLAEKYGITRSAIPLARIISHMNTISDKKILLELGDELSSLIFSKEIPRDPDGIVQRTMIDQIMR